MSSITSTQAGQGLAQFLQSLTASQTGSASSSNASSSSSTVSSALNSLAQAIGGGHHHHSHGTANGFSKLAQAVTNVLQSAQSTGSTSDPNQTIISALEKIFKNSGSVGSTYDTDSSDNTGDGDASSTTNDISSAQQSFLQTLQSFGVSPQQFQQDLTTALKDAQGGQINLSTAFQSFPTGSLIDAVG
jgi:hypothetical protein